MKFNLLAVVFLFVLFPMPGAFSQTQYYLPHVANGSNGGWTIRTTFILFNNSDADVTVVLSLTDDNGSPLTLTISGLGTDSQFVFNLNAGSTGFLQTDGLGAGTVGAAVVSATTPIGVSAIFTVYDANGKYTAEAGVGSSGLMTDFMLPVDSTGSSLTGLALFNPSADATVTLTLRNAEGIQAGTTTIRLNSFNHIAHFVGAPQELFPTATNFRGTLSIHSTSPIAALVLRQYQNASLLSYTSLPAASQSSTQLVLNLAQIATGSYGPVSFKTSFLIFNISLSPATVSLSLSQDNGLPLTVTIPGSGTGSNFRFTLGAGASIFLQTDGSGAGTAGAATVTSNVPVGASAIFTVLDAQGQFQTEAGVGNSPVLSSFTLPVDINGKFDTGVAFYNPGANSVSVILNLLDSKGVLVNSATEILAPQNHLARFVDEIFPGLANFKGSLAVTAAGGVASTALRQYGVAATYTTLPTASGTSTGKTQVTPVLPAKVTGINALAGDPDISISQRLSSGSVLSGTVSGAGRGITVVASPGGNTSYSSQVNPIAGRYLIIVPDGT